MCMSQETIRRNQHDSDDLFPYEKRQALKAPARHAAIFLPHVFLKIVFFLSEHRRKYPVQIRKLFDIMCQKPFCDH